MRNAENAKIAMIERFHRSHYYFNMRMTKKFTSLLVILAATSAWAEPPKPKYGPEAQTLTSNHAYFHRADAPDFWALSPAYVGQQTGAACSVASVTMVMNAARATHPLAALTSEDELISQNSLLKKVGDESWTQATDDSKSLHKGVTLDRLGELVGKTFKAYGYEGARIQVVHFDDDSAKSLAQLHAALESNEKSADDFIILNFNQGIYTGDADAGHIAPLAAFDRRTRQALVMDPDRQWYEPYWVSERTLLKGMATPDKASGKTRGYVRVSLAKSAATK
jgi:hypothetical protein